MNSKNYFFSRPTDQDQYPATEIALVSHEKF
jgi:hypothetical protein